MYEALFGPQHANKGRTLDLQITKWGYFCRKSTFMKSTESSNTNSKWVGNFNGMEDMGSNTQHLCP